MFKYVNEFTQPLRKFDYADLKVKKAKDEEMEKLLQERVTKDQKLKKEAF